MNVQLIDSISSSGLKQLEHPEEDRKKFDKITAFVNGRDAFDTNKFIEQFGKSDPEALAKLTTENIACHPKILEMFQHIHATSKFVTTTLALSGAWHHDLKFIPLELTECACYSGAFHRIKSPRRNNLENAVTKRLSDSIPDKNEPLHLLSMGSGGLMGDFFTLEKLVLAGFKKITIDCIDPIGIKEERVQRIKEFFEDYPEVTIEINAYSTIEEVPKEKKGYSAVIAIDYDELGGIEEKKLRSTGDLMKAYNRLNENGCLCIGFGQDDDTLYGPNMDPEVIGKKPTFANLLTQELSGQLPESQELVMGVEALDNIVALSLALAIKRSGKQYSKISLSCFATDQKYEWSNSYKMTSGFLSMMEAMFPHTEIEITLGGKGDKKCDIMMIRSETEEYKSKKYLELLNEKSTVYLFRPGGKLYRNTMGSSLTKIVQLPIV